MRKKLILPLIAIALGVGLVGTACSSSDSSDAKSDEATTTTKAGESTTTAMSDMKNIVEIAQGNPDFSTLVSLVGEAGLAETLSGSGPFTVFAPTNAAFAKLPASTVEALKADPKGALANVLKLHVISGKVTSEQAAKAAGTCVDTLGGKVKVEKSGDNLTIGGATITTTDLEASNGVIHVIDSVIAAPSTDC
ncbi:MAG: fasciclin domain-containing protein [Microthrixaceae bacterium]